MLIFTATLSSLVTAVNLTGTKIELHIFQAQQQQLADSFLLCLSEMQIEMEIEAQKKSLKKNCEWQEKTVENNNTNRSHRKPCK